MPDTQGYKITKPEERVVNGETKTSWHEVGVMFPRKDGSFFIKLHMFEGTFSAFPIDPAKKE